jgi:prevent-host-death family protein
MRTINIQTATAELSRLVDAAGDGEEIIISRSGKPIARLMPLPAPSTTANALTQKHRRQLAQVQVLR